MALPRPVQPRITVSFEEIFLDDVDAAAKNMGYDSSEQLRRRLSLGRRFFVAKSEEAIVAYGWISTEAECIGEMEREIRLQPGEAYIWDCFTYPEYRRQRLYSALLSHINTTLAGEGCRRIWIGSNLENRPSLRGFANAGYRPVSQITYLRLGTLCCLWFSSSPGAPNHLTTIARDAFSLETDRYVGPLVFGWMDSANHIACLEPGN